METNKIYDCIIIGCGASGLFAGCNFSNKIDGLILESNKKPGRKILMSGGGSCNITHSGSIKEFADCYFDKGKKIRSLLYKHSNQEMMDFFQNEGLPLITREDGKVFPASMIAGDVLNTLINTATHKGFEIKTDSKVSGIMVIDDESDNHLFCVKTNSSLGQCSSYTSKNLVIATGGCSYPTTGSDGSIFSILEETFGLTIEKPRPALSPIYVENYPYSTLSGISFENISCKVIRDGKEIAKETGPMIFTENYFSGPAFLHLSRFCKPGDTLSINYIDTKDIGSWRKEMNAKLNDSKQAIHNQLAKALSFPKSFLSLICNTESDRPSQITKRLTDDRFVIDKVGGFNVAMATAGGVSLTDVNMKTMELKNCKGAYIIGEALDVDGRTGGYNIQFAYSSACTAAKNIDDDVSQ